MLRSYISCKQYFLVLQHSLFRRRNWRSSGDDRSERQAPEFVRSCGCAVIFCTNATSGIMRRRHLMCARCKEQSDGIAIATKSIASSVPARRALPNGRRGKHVGKGDMHLKCSHSHYLIYKKKEHYAPFFQKYCAPTPTIHTEVETK